MFIKKGINKAVKFANALIKKIKMYPAEIVFKLYKIKSICRRFMLDNVSFLMLINTKEKGLSKQLAMNDWREYDSTKYFINSFLENTEVILEIGANIGYFTLIEAAFSNENIIYAIEPVNDNFSLLCANVALNNFNNVRLFNFAISDKNENAKMVVCDYRNWSTIDKSRIEYLKANDINYFEQNITLYDLQTFTDQHVKLKPTLLRMDVEGHEYEIIMGNQEFLRRYKPKLFIEFHSNILGKVKSLELLCLLKSCDYTLVACIKNYEFCGNELYFKPISNSNTPTSLQQLIDLYNGMSESQIIDTDGYELFLKPQTTCL